MRAAAAPSALCSTHTRYTRLTRLTHGSALLSRCWLCTFAAKIQNDLRILTERLARINDNLARKITSRNEYDKTIQETEAAYLKILESSQTLLTVLKRESMGLEKKSTGPGAV